MSEITMHIQKAEELRETLEAMLEYDDENPAAIVLSSRVLVYSPIDQENFLVANCAFTEGPEEKFLIMAKTMLERTGNSVVVRFPSEFDYNKGTVITTTTTLLSEADKNKEEDDTQWPWNLGLSPEIWTGCC